MSLARPGQSAGLVPPRRSSQVFWWLMRPREQHLQERARRWRQGVRAAAEGTPSRPEGVGADGALRRAEARRPRLRLTYALRSS
eukprot:11704008-Alexandrium_andersonii.AAC.1